MGWRKRTAPENEARPRTVDHEEDNETATDKGYGKPYKYDADFSGPTKHRSCTDIVCLLLFLAFLGGWGFVAYYGISYGDINKVIYPTDSMGRVCGEGNMENRPFLLFYDLTKCLNPAVLSLGCPTKQVCVSECPDKNLFGLTLNPSQALSIMKPFCDPSDEDINSKSYQDLVTKKACPAWVLNSKPFLGRCMPSLVDESNKDDNTTVINADQTVDGKPVKKGTLKHALTALGAFLSIRDFGERVFNDLSDSWWMIGIGLSLAFVLSFIWIILMRFLTSIMVWTSIGLSFLAFLGLFGYSLYRYMLIRNDASAQDNIFQVNLTPSYFDDVLGLSDTWLAFTCICGIVSLIILLVLIALRERIQVITSAIFLYSIK